MGMVPLIPEVLAKIRPTEPLRLAKRAALCSRGGGQECDLQKKGHPDHRVTVTW